MTLAFRAVQVELLCDRWRVYLSWTTRTPELCAEGRHQCPPPQIVLDLIERFHTHRDAYKAPEYNETQVRREFIDPFFKALGWDIDNEKGYSQQWKEVVHEDAIKVGGVTRAPDYSFRLGGRRLFLLEAKKPSVSLADDSKPAFQLRRYAWSVKASLSILTDFEEFVVYDTRVRPAITDKPSTARLLYIKYEDYGERWDEIAALFSPQAIQKGAFDKFVESKRKRGTAEVDDAFLAEIEEWRQILARNIALRNSDLSQRELNFAVQRTIDRIVFLRICEDRGIEEYGRLYALLNGAEVYERLRVIYERADERYNSGLFHFHREKGRRDAPDELTLRLAIDDAPLKQIFKRLYYPDCPYEFSVLPAEILGQVYERFLGSVIRLTAGHRAVIEQKPEVRKAGCVYYTPAYIVRYIVEHAIGNLLEGKTPQEVSGATENWKPAKAKPALSVLDPACGSGSFLLGAYQHLLDWYLDQYSQAPRKWARGGQPRLFQDHRGTWRLTTSERKRILLTHIFGVDIDSQAVEVTKLSLLLKVLEHENTENIEKQLTLFHTRALPDLSENIKCGNSLIGSDYYRERQQDLFDANESIRINAFDWDKEFPGIEAGGGFSAVIGNPPYVLLQDEFRDEEQLKYFRENYGASAYKLDMYHLFMELGIRRTRPGGRMSMITPSNFLTNNHLKNLRQQIIDTTRVDHILVVDGGVFANVSVDSTISVFVPGETPSLFFPVIHGSATAAGIQVTSRHEVNVDNVRQNDHFLFTRNGGSAADSPLGDFPNCAPLGNVAYVNFGKQLRDRRQFPGDVVESLVAPKDKRYKKCLTGRDVGRYRLRWNHLWCLDDDEEARRGGCWDAERQNGTNKLITRQIGRYPEFGFDETGLQCLNTVFMVNLFDERLSPFYVLGVLNSSLLRCLWLRRYYDQRRTFPKIKGTYLKELPIRIPDFENSRDKERHQQIVTHARRIMELSKRSEAARTSHEKTLIGRQMETADRAIDGLVYDLYELTDEQIVLVEAEK